MPAVRIVYVTTAYTTDPDDILGGGYAVGDSLYLATASLKLTNVVADGSANFGVVAEVLEEPDLEVTADRMVIRLTAAAELLAPLKALLAAQEL